MYVERDFRDHTKKNRLGLRGKTERELQDMRRQDAFKAEKNHAETGTTKARTSVDKRGT